MKLVKKVYENNFNKYIGTKNIFLLNIKSHKANTHFFDNDDDDTTEDVGRGKFVEFNPNDFIDILNDDYIADMKLMKDINDIWVDGAKIPFWEAYHYDIQASIYQYLEMQRTGIRKPYYLIVVTKEEIPSKYIFKFSDETLDKALDMVKNLAPRYDAIKKGLIEPNECGNCRYYKINHKFTNKEIKEI